METPILDPNAMVSDSVRFKWHLGIFISIKFPGDAHTAVSETTILRTSLYSQLEWRSGMRKQTFFE